MKSGKTGDIYERCPFHDLWGYCIGWIFRHFFAIADPLRVRLSVGNGIRSNRMEKGENFVPHLVGLLIFKGDLTHCY
jgi:hypothetical protein